MRPDLGDIEDVEAVVVGVPAELELGVALGVAARRPIEDTFGLTHKTAKAVHACLMSACCGACVKASRNLH